MATTTNYGWTTPDDTALVKDGAAAIRTLGSSVDTTTKNLNPSTTLGDIEYRSSTANTNTRLGIGTTGQVLSVVGGVPAWATSDDANAIQNAIVDAKGDIITATAADTPARLAVGANGTTLVADSSEATGLKWAAPAGGGKVLQVINAGTTTVGTSSSSTYADTNLTATITPSSASSKILVFVHQNGCLKYTNTDTRIGIKLLRDATVIQTIGELFLFSNSAHELYGTTISTSYLDSPATTSAITYKTQFASTGNNAAVEVQANAVHRSTITLMEIGA